MNLILLIVLLVLLFGGAPLTYTAFGPAYGGGFGLVLLVLLVLVILGRL